MPLQLRDNLHWCNCQGRAVFLDTEADRYFCLPNAGNEAFLRLGAGTMEPGDAERLHMLIAQGMLIEAGEPARLRRPAQIEAPTHDVLEEPMQRMNLLWTLEALASELRAGRALRTKSFHEVIEAARRRKRRSGSAGCSDGAIQKIVSATAAVSLIRRSHDRCLVRALAVHSVCRRNGIASKLVFGVIAHPFTAHCWVQLGDGVLVGGYEQARLHTPILALE